MFEDTFDNYNGDLPFPWNLGTGSGTPATGGNGGANTSNSSNGNGFESLIDYQKGEAKYIDPNRPLSQRQLENQEAYVIYYNELTQAIKVLNVYVRDYQSEFGQLPTTLLSEIKTLISSLAATATSLVKAGILTAAATAPVLIVVSEFLPFLAVFALFDSFVSSKIAAEKKDRALVVISQQKQAIERLKLLIEETATIRKDLAIEQIQEDNAKKLTQVIKELKTNKNLRIPLNVTASLPTSNQVIELIEKIPTWIWAVIAVLIVLNLRRRK